MQIVTKIYILRGLMPIRRLYTRLGSLADVPMYDNSWGKLQQELAEGKSVTDGKAYREVQRKVQELLDDLASHHPRSSG